MEQSLRGEDDVVETLEHSGRNAVHRAGFRLIMGLNSLVSCWDKWAYDHGVTIDFSRPGKPTDNAFVESFNGSFRDDV